MRYLALLVFGLLISCAGERQDVREPEERDALLDLYLEIFDAYEPLSECVRGQLDTGSLSFQSAFDHVVDSDGAVAFVRRAERILDVGSDALRPDDPEEGDKALIASLMMRLAAFGGASNDSDDSGMRLRRMSAIVHAFGVLASATGGACVPSNSLERWMEQVPWWNG